MSDLPIAGLQRFGLSDYPGCVAATVFTQGCNFRCPYCHNGQLVAPAAAGDLVPNEELWRFLESRRRYLDGVVVSGGEPTIHAALPAVLERLRALGFRVKLDTNGSNPGMLRALFGARLVDYVAMDVKAPLRDQAYRRLSGVGVRVADIRESIRMIADADVDHEFRTTHVPSLHADGDLSAIRASLPPSSPWRIQRFRPERALDVRLRLHEAEGCAPPEP